MEQGELALSDREFGRVKARVYAEAGISLSDAKRTLVVSRLSKIVRALELPSIDSYLDHLERSGSAADGQAFINALTTNLTRFYREDHHFEHLIGYVRGLMERGGRSTGAQKPRLRLWSAGCSTGQEPYTMALCLLDALPELRRWDFRILATDIDTAVIEKASIGVYSEAELNGLSSQRARLLERPGDGTIRVPMAARAVVTFKPLNLMVDWPMRGPFDAIFCRNVAIYFDKQTQAALFNRLGKLLAPGGFLYIGHSENLGTSAAGFKLVGKTIYQSRDVQKTRDAA